MRMEQLLYHENQGIWMIDAAGQTYSVRVWSFRDHYQFRKKRPRALYSFILILLACVIFIDFSQLAGTPLM